MADGSGTETSVPPEVPVEEIVSIKEARQSLPLYAPRVKVHPKKISGTFRHLKWAALILLLAVYYIAPWLRWDRAPGIPDQAFLIDMPNRRAYFLWIEIWPQEVYYLAGLLILGALGLFLATALLGRVWCGYACPQTVWTDLFMWVERLIEGDRGARMRLDKAPWGGGKIAKKAFKHGIWLVISVLTGGAWIMYFNDAPTLAADVLTWSVTPTVLLFIGLFTATTYLLGGIAREQVCTYMCPWPRFQAAMTDEDTAIVTYERWRGEPRGPHKKGESWDGRGDCVDCAQCVAVCPTGIDIRDGNQLECIGCGLCIDACNDIMARVGRPSHLITYDSIARQQARAAGRTARFRMVRPRTLAYAGLLLIVGSVMMFTLATRPRLDLNVQHDRNPLFVTLSDGAVRNGYTVKILNPLHEARTFVLRAEGLPGASLRAVGQDGEGADQLRFVASPDAVATQRVFVTLPASAITGTLKEFNFVLTEAGGAEEERRAATVFRAGNGN